VEDNGKFRWRVNLKSIIQNLPHIIGHFPLKSESYHGPTLFIGGAKSDYIKYQKEIMPPFLQSYYFIYLIFTFQTDRS
jgi:hypothetical protein